MHNNECFVVLVGMNGGKWGRGGRGSRVNVCFVVSDASTRSALGGTFAAAAASCAMRGGARLCHARAGPA
jgi:hypothetical protein